LASKQRAAARLMVPERLRLASGVLPEPHLLFGGGHRHIDPRTGLALYGPYSLADQDEPAINTVRIGIVSTGPLMTEMRSWIAMCRRQVTNDGSQPFLYPPFPGMDPRGVLRCELATSRAWEETIAEKTLRLALGTDDYFQRLGAVMALFRDGVRNLAERQPRPDVVVCVIPKEVLEFCTVQPILEGGVRRLRLTKGEKVHRARLGAGQQTLFDVAFGDEDEEADDAPGHRDLRRALKAETMAFGIPIQLVRESTLRPGGGLGRRVQDPATRAWNFCVGLYYKAGGQPWRLADLQPDTCYVGIEFYREHGAAAQVRTSLAQVFSHRSDGLVLRGQPFDWDQPGHAPHLTRDQARQLLADVLAVYQRHSKRAPLRVVVHKSSRYWDEELQGFRQALEGIPEVDLVAFGKRGLQLLRHGSYPPLRGTWVRFADDDFLIYTKGYVPFLRTYPGPRAPQPLELLEHHGDTPAEAILAETLGLSKLNWNTTDFSCDEPMTLAFADRVGEILAELPADVQPQPDYRYYM
jgi:hypothetical protein